MTNIVSLRSDGSHAPHAPSERRTQQRARILDAARQVFAQKRTAATMSDIAAAAEVSHGLTYRYFTSKEQIFADIVEQAAQSAPWEGFLTMAGSPLERLRILVARVVYLQGPAGNSKGLPVRYSAATEAPRVSPSWCVGSIAPCTPSCAN